MVERITDPTRPVQLPHGIGRHPDGDRVPHRPRPAPPLTLRQMLPGFVVAALVLALLAVGIAW